jgi:hypothetical protein
MQRKFSQKLSMKQYSFVFPETISEYIAAGVGVFKIGGRTNPSEWVYDCAKAYHERRRRGNYYHIMNSLGSNLRKGMLFRRIVTLLPEPWIYGVLKAAYFFYTKEGLRNIVATAPY